MTRAYYYEVRILSDPDKLAKHQEQSKMAMRRYRARLKGLPACIVCDKTTKGPNHPRCPSCTGRHTRSQWTPMSPKLSRATWDEAEVYINCLECGEECIKKNKLGLYCSRRCQSRAYRRRKKGQCINLDLRRVSTKAPSLRSIRVTSSTTMGTFATSSRA